MSRKSEKLLQRFHIICEIVTEMSHIDIVINYEENEQNIKMKNTTKMSNAFRACCDKFGLRPENYILSKGGVQINENENAIYNKVKHGDVLDIEKYVESKHENITAKTSVARPLICYCTKCGLLQERTYEDIGLFRVHSHMNSKLDDRCLDIGKYNDNNTAIMNVGFYVMSPK